MTGETVVAARAAAQRAGVFVLCLMASGVLVGAKTMLASVWGQLGPAAAASQRASREALNQQLVGLVQAAQAVSLLPVRDSHEAAQIDRLSVSHPAK